MDTPRNFRSAFHGFNREDVVHYLEYINARHTAQVNQLTAEADALRSNPPQAGESSDQANALEARCAELEAQLDAALSENEALKARCEALEARPAETPSELSFYRRAEQTEQAARDRSELMYFQASGVLNEATAKVEGIAAEITEMADGVMDQLTQLQMAVSGSKHALQDAAAIMKTIRPNK